MLKTYIKRIFVFVITSIIILSSFSLLIFANDNIDNNAPENISNPKFGKWNNVPLLVILISYDANGNGVDDYNPSDSTKLFRDSSSEYYGEQWITSRDDTWANRLFGNNNSVSAFYKKMTLDRFTFVPAKESYSDPSRGGVENDGIIHVVINAKHPFAETGNQSTESTKSRNLALKEATKYLDVKSFDLNNDNIISDNELCIMYIAAGTEYSAVSLPGGINNRLHFSVHAHYTRGVSIKVDNVQIGGGGFTRIGEYINATTIAPIGVMSHELGHFLGAPDLYDTVGSWNYVGSMSLMASGSWLKNDVGKGMGPAYLDAPLMVDLGFSDYTEITQEGTYTVSNRDSKNPYNIFKISTPNPNEYYLIENRYSSEDSIYDKIGERSKGIIIWHVDQQLLNNGYSVNSSSTSGVVTRDPAIVIMTDNGLTASSCAYYANSKTSSNIFTPKNPKYKFPYSETCFTKLNGEQAENFNFTITILSNTGNDMKFKVDFYDNMPVYISSFVSDITISSAQLNGCIPTYNKKNVNKVSFIVSKNSNPTESNGLKYDCVLDNNGNFTASIDNLEQNTKYFYKALVESNGSTIEKINYFYTDFIKKERTDYYIVYLYKALSSVERSFEVKVKPGNTLTYSFPMSKLGYTFCGWYTDPDLENKYDMSYTQETCDDFSLYAKWVQSDNTAALVLHGANSKYKTFSIELGDTFTYVEPVDRNGYIFDGWFVDEDLTVPFNFDDAVYTSGEINIYAKWLSENGATEIETTIGTTTQLDTEKQTIESTENSSSILETSSNNEKKNENSNILVIILIIALIVLVLVIIIVIIGKKKHSNKNNVDSTNYD